MSEHQAEEGDIPFNSPVTEQVDPGKALTATYRPEQRTGTFRLPILAASKAPESTYTVWLDDEQVYGPAAVPPTDVDDLQPTFFPPYRFENKLQMEIANVSSSTTRTYTIQPVGWEVSNNNQGGA